MHKTKLNTSIHIGNIISKVLEDKHISVAELANQLHTDKSNMYKILRKSHIDTEVLYRICQILDYNFFSDYCEYENNSNTHDRMRLALIKAKETQLDNLSATSDIEIIFKEND
jgi:hypothetical protein